MVSCVEYQLLSGIIPPSFPLPPQLQETYWRHPRSDPQTPGTRSRGFVQTWWWMWWWINSRREFFNFDFSISMRLNIQNSTAKCARTVIGFACRFWLSVRLGLLWPEGENKAARHQHVIHQAGGIKKSTQLELNLFESNLNSVSRERLCSC